MPHAYVHSIQFRRLYWRQRNEFNLQVLSLQLLGVPFDKLSILSIHCYTGPSFLMASDDHESLLTDVSQSSHSTAKRGHETDDVNLGQLRCTSSLRDEAAKRPGDRPFR